MGRITTRAVNRALREEGFVGVKLVPGKDYWYFTGPGTEGWRSTAVYTMRLNDLALDQWVAEAKAKDADKH